MYENVFCHLCSPFLSNKCKKKTLITMLLIYICAIDKLSDLIGSGYDNTQNTLVSSQNSAVHKQSYFTACYDSLVLPQRHYPRSSASSR